MVQLITGKWITIEILTEYLTSNYWKNKNKYRMTVST